MNAHIKHQIIEKDGAPLFVLVPYNEYVAGLKKQEEIYFPHEVVELHAIEGKSLVRAWREYKGFSQKKVAAKINISQSAFSQMEKPDATLRRSTLEKIAAALEISVEQLMD